VIPLSVALLCPGQGAQFPGFLHCLPSHAQVKRTLLEAGTILGYDMLELDTPEALRSTVSVQLAIVVAGVAVARALSESGVRPRAVTGLSIGAFTAAVICGAIELAEALALVQLRGELMRAAFPGSYGMGVIQGLEEIAVQRLIERISTSEAPVYLASVNAPLEFAVAGSDRGIERCFDAARESGARSCVRLAVSVPSHCALLANAASTLAERVAKAPLSAPAVPYVTNRSARVTSDKEAVRDDLAFNLMFPVRWHDATAALYEHGVRLYIELPPGRVLSRLIATAFPDARAFAIADSPISHAVMLARRAQLASA
jgi:malonate decarboxylase epsilon subunit